MSLKLVGAEVFYDWFHSQAQHQTSTRKRSVNPFTPHVKFYFQKPLFLTTLHDSFEMSLKSYLALKHEFLRPKA